MQYRDDLTAAYVRSILHYNRRTGVFCWKVRRKGIRVGDVAGDLRKGYRRIGIDFHRYRAARLAWLYVTGSWPTHEVDHKNRNKSDDRFSNLRPATHAQNLRNVAIKRNNTSGVKGVSWDRSRRKWVAMITVHGHQKNLGRFNTKTGARNAYRSAAANLHGEFARVA